MTIEIKIATVDRTGIIDRASLQKEDNLNSAVDTLRFSINKSPSVSYTPTLNDEVVMTDTDTSTILFGGRITDVVRSLDGNLLKYDITCTDYVQDLDSQLVLERYENQTVSYIIDHLLTNYATGFTGTNVAQADIELDAITFNRVTISQALTTLAKTLNYYWYVDYEKDLHFFPKSEESAPFDLTDTSENYIYDSLEVVTDFSQIRNKVVVKGGETEANQRTILLSGTGNNRSFALGYKFSKLPTILLGGVPQVVGLAGLDADADKDVLWDFNQKNIEFASDNIPPAAVENISVTGIPLLPLAVYVTDLPSQTTYGLREYVVEDKRLITRDAAIDFGQAELEAYKDPLYSVKFDTYTSGLRSGQEITVNCPSREINETFIISRVSLTFISDDLFVWSVDASSARTYNFVQMLQALFESDDVDINTLETIYGVVELPDNITITDSLSPRTSTIGPYYYATTTGGNQVGRYNYSTYQ